MDTCLSMVINVSKKNDNKEDREKLLDSISFKAYLKDIPKLRHVGKKMREYLKKNLLIIFCVAVVTLTTGGMILILDGVSILLSTEMLLLIHMCFGIGSIISGILILGYAIWLVVRVDAIRKLSSGDT